MFKAILSSVLLVLLFSCDKKIKPLTYDEEGMFKIDTLRIANLKMVKTLKSVSPQEDSTKRADLMIQMKDGDFSDLSSLYFGSSRYSPLLQIYNGYSLQDSIPSSKDSLYIPSFERLVLNMSNLSKQEPKVTDSLLEVYRIYRFLEKELNTYNALSNNNTKLPDPIKKDLIDLSNRVAAVYFNLQERPDRPHETIGQLKALSNYLVRMTHDSLSTNKKSVEMVHYRLAATFLDVSLHQ